MFQFSKVREVVTIPYTPISVSSSACVNSIERFLKTKFAIDPLNSKLYFKFPLNVKLNKITSLMVIVSLIIPCTFKTFVFTKLDYPLMLSFSMAIFSMVAFSSISINLKELLNVDSVILIVSSWTLGVD